MKNISEILNWKIVLLGLILGLVLFLLSFAVFGKYRSTVTILMITKSPYAASQQKEILTNIASLPKTLTFYNKLIKEHGEIIDTQDKTDSEKKKIWDKTLKIKPKKDSSIIEISILADNKDDAQLVAQKTARALFDTASMYYNVKNDIDLRQIDGPINDWVFDLWYMWLVGSMILGLMIAMIVFSAFPSDKNKITEKTQIAKNKITEKSQNFSFKKFFEKPAFFSPSSKTDEAVKNELKKEEKEGGSMTPPEDIPTPMSNVTSPEEEEKKELEALEKIIQQDIYPNYPEMPRRAEAKSSAPDNLPIADDSFLHQESQTAEEKEQEKEEAQDIAEKTPAVQEPTPDELKKRLNQLLSGK